VHTLLLIASEGVKVCPLPPQPAPVGEPRPAVEAAQSTLAVDAGHTMLLEPRMAKLMPETDDEPTVTTRFAVPDEPVVHSGEALCETQYVPGATAENE